MPRCSKVAHRAGRRPSGVARNRPGVSNDPAEIGTSKLLRAVFETPPRRNKPEDFEGDGFDCELKIGTPAGQPDSVIRASYNDLFSRPLAVVGNTGSGKSFTVTSLIQKAMEEVRAGVIDPHILILDINGEYERAFNSVETKGRAANKIYLNGQEFGVPIWFFNAGETVLG